MISGKGPVIVVVVVSIGVVVASLMVMGSTLGNEQSGRRIVVLDHQWDGSVTARYVKVGDLKPNSSISFLDPFGKTMQEFYRRSADPNPALLVRLLQSRDADAYEYYRLIRLPEIYGGGKE